MLLENNPNARNESGGETTLGPKRRARGFAKLVRENPERQREIASRGGEAAQRRGTAHRFKVGSDEARRAGRLGGLHSRGGRAAGSAA